MSALPFEQVTPFPVPQAGRWTAADLDRMPDNGLRYEVLNGQLIVNAAPKPRHQWLIKRLERALDDALPDDRFVLAGVGVLIGDDEPIPDLTVARGPVPMDDRGVAVADVELVVEVVSSLTTLQDRMVKPAFYAAAGIPNYWRIEINPFKGRLPAEDLPVLFVYSLDDLGEYQLAHRVPAGQPVALRSPFEFTVDTAAWLR
ncbi:MAG: Uma2 family endonuclease [Thermomicrobiales bacterium]|nr:Uma2 family endonuclease [Thermomicrobiales bacterium]